MRFISLLVLFLLSIDACWMISAGIRFAPLLLLFPIFSLESLLVFALYRRVRPASGKRFGPCLYLMALLAFGTLALTLLSYLMARLDYPLLSQQFAAADRALGLNWQWYLIIVSRHPDIERTLSWSYYAMNMEAVLLMAGFMAMGDVARLKRYVAWFLLSACACIVMSGLWPSIDAYSHYHIDTGHYPLLKIPFMKAYLPDYLAMRAHKMDKIALSVNGIITFPSFHAAFATLVLCMAGGFKPRWLRLPLYCLNGLMLLSIPVVGGHYFVDVLAGIAISLILWPLMRRIAPPGDPANSDSPNISPSPTMAPKEKGESMRNADLIRARLESGLAPQKLEVVDESAQHAGHAGATPGGDSHFRLEIVSDKFKGVSRVERHRLIYKALGDAFDAGLHALRIEAKAPGE